ncbi:hypothetical protein F4781DRAFT_389488 [Annulohypoxylon bovei var. microspora]|nr:hypothetical protein F4781DRAFT_389488 [Annulohypoxylon bovei var. microspora]
MIKDEWRWFAPGGAISPGGPSTWYILDWDQRRIIAVTMDEEQDSEDVAVEHLKKHIDNLASDVYAIRLSQDGDLISVSTDLKHDETLCEYHPPLQEIQKPDCVKTVTRLDLVELDRLGPNVDLVSYTPCPNIKKPKKVVFKYYFLAQFVGKIWTELNLWMRLPQHQNIVPFDRIVLDELEGQVVGFTSLYIPGGTIEENLSRVFKLKWLKQLIHVVDDLNLKYGIAHQDIAPYNLLVNPETDALMLFDFNFSGRIGDFNYAQDRDDVKGVIFTLYEIITRDDHFRRVPHDQQDISDVEGLDDWIKHPDVKLDHPVSEYRSFLSEWVKERREGKQMTIYTEAPEYIYWPDINEPPKKEKPTAFSTIMVSSWAVSRRLMPEGSVILHWERPLQNKLIPGTQLLANGKIIANT